MTRAPMTGPALTMTMALLLLAGTPQTQAFDRYAVTGMIVSVDAAQRTFVASVDPIPGFMAAMSMPFTVRDVAALTGLVPGAMVAFTLVVENGASHAEGVRIRPPQNVEPDPLAARRLSLLTQTTRGTPGTRIAIGETVPDFTLIDQQSRRVTLSQHRGKVVAINFMYTTCQLPDFCLRLVNHFGVLQKRFAPQLGRDLLLLTITFDPVRDRPEVLERYARQWQPHPDAWRFLTGAPPDVRRVLDHFGVSAFPNDGLMDHSLQTVLVDRAGRLAAALAGNHYTSAQLADLTASVLDGRAVASVGK